MRRVNVLKKIFVPDDGMGRHARPLDAGVYELIPYGDGRRFTIRRQDTYRVEVTDAEVEQWKAAGLLIVADLT